MPLNKFLATKKGMLIVLVIALLVILIANIIVPFLSA
jgi:hypothetical protein